MTRNVTVYGAYGHTGRFVVAEFERRGFNAILAGRDAAKLQALASGHPAAEVRVAEVGDSAALDRALAGASAVVNCAGPFATTAGPVIEAALRAGIAYIDIAAEIEANLDTFERYEGAAREAGITILPAMAFYGGLGDLLATIAMTSLPDADEINVAYGLTGWAPTSGTLAAGRVSRERRGGRRIIYSAGEFQLVDGPLPTGDWQFPAPLGKRAVIGEFTMADAVTISRHHKVREIRSFMTADAVAELVGSSGPADRNAERAESFVHEVVARHDGTESRASARGRDIYASTAPLVVEAADRLLKSPSPMGGVFTAGQLFDACDFLQSLSCLSIQLNQGMPS